MKYFISMYHLISSNKDIWVELKWEQFQFRIEDMEKNDVKKRDFCGTGTGSRKFAGKLWERDWPNIWTREKCGNGMPISSRFSSLPWGTFRPEGYERTQFRIVWNKYCVLNVHRPVSASWRCEMNSRFPLNHHGFREWLYTGHWTDVIKQTHSLRSHHN